MSVSTVFPFEELEAFTAEVTSAGGNGNDVAVMVAELVDFRQVFPGPVGELLERIDDPLARSGLVGKAIDLVRKLKPFRKRAAVHVGN